MARTDQELTIALDQLKRAVDNQLSALKELQTKVGTALGFNLTAIGLLFAFGATYISGHRFPATISAALLLSSAGLLGAGFVSFFVLDVPDPNWLLKKLNDPRVGKVDLLEALVANYAGAYVSNARGSFARLLAVNLGIALIILGVGVFVVGVLLPS